MMAVMNKNEMPAIKITLNMYCLKAHNYFLTSLPQVSKVVREETKKPYQEERIYFKNFTFFGLSFMPLSFAILYMP